MAAYGGLYLFIVAACGAALDFAFASSLTPTPFIPLPRKGEEEPSLMSMLSSRPGRRHFSVSVTESLYARGSPPRLPRGRFRSAGFITWERSEAHSTAGALQRPQGGIPQA